MRQAVMFDGVREGRPYFAADHPRVEDSGLLGLICGFLEAGSVVVRSTYLDQDYFDERGGKVVPVSTFTDGEWIWNAGIVYYAKTYGLAPEKDFLEYMKAKNYEPGVVTREAIIAVTRELEHVRRRPV